MGEKKKYVSENAQLMLEWDWDKNRTISPQNTTIGSHIKIWWRCIKGHEYEAQVNSRSMGRGCPICAGKTIVPGINDLASQNPKVAAEWHPTKNGTLLPNMVAPKSNKKVWWLCCFGHEWEAKVETRTNGIGCPFCSGKRIINGKNDLASQNPILAVEWHPTKNGELSPQDVMCGSDKKVWWLGKCGHEWQASILNRSRGTGCPVCWSESATSFPEQAILYYCKKVTTAYSRNVDFGKEIDVFLPELSIGIEFNGFFHKDIRRDEKKVDFFKRKGIRIISVYGKDDYTCNRAYGDIIEFVYHTTNKSSLNWAISKIFELLGTPSPEIDVKADEASILEQYVLSRKENSLAVCSPQLASEWHPTKNGRVTAETIAYGSHKRMWWLGKCGHEWQATVLSRHGGAGCPVCDNKLIVAGINDLKTQNPDLASEWHPTKNGELLPSTISAGSHKKVWWLGKCGHEWQAQVKSRSNGAGCPICSGFQILQGFNDLATTCPDLVDEWHPTKNTDVTPYSVSRGTEKKVWWLGKCGHEWQASIKNRTSFGYGCPICARLKRKKVNGN